MKKYITGILPKAFITLILVVAAVGCSSPAATQPAVTQTAPTQTAPAQPTQASATLPDSTPAVVESPAAGAPASSPTPAAIQVTYLTPAQAEGPYYPLQKPDERDNDLTTLSGAAGKPAGERLLLQGRVYDRNGQPMQGVLVEIWQTDYNGIYLHPGDANTGRRDLNFQFYGEALTAADGSYSFLTIIPGEYEPRPRHIHVKLKRDGSELLTTQFYFPDDLAASADGIFASAGEAANALLVALQPGSDEQGALLLGERDVILDLDS